MRPARQVRNARIPVTILVAVIIAVVMMWPITNLFRSYVERPTPTIPAFDPDRGSSEAPQAAQSAPAPLLTEAERTAAGDGLASLPDPNSGISERGPSRCPRDAPPPPPLRSGTAWLRCRLRPGLRQGAWCRSVPYRCTWRYSPRSVGPRRASSGAPPIACRARPRNRRRRARGRRRRGQCSKSGRAWCPSPRRTRAAGSGGRSSSARYHCLLPAEAALAVRWAARISSRFCRYSVRPMSPRA
jgi:hypothetical protein